MKNIFTYRLLGLAIAFMFLLHSKSSVAQWTVDILGTVKKEETKKRFEGVTITVKRNGTVWKTIESPENGEFNASLLPEAVYLIEFSKPGHVTKRIEVSTKNIPPEDAKYGFDFPMEINLFEEMDGLDVSVLNKPIGKVAFDPTTGYMGYDKDYTKSIQNELDRLKKELEERLKQQEAERKEKQKAYDAAISLADKAFNSEKWEDAKPNYEKAASIFPKEDYPVKQLAEIKAQLDKLAEANKAYNEAIADGDAAFKAREWPKATTAYQKASDLKEKEQYPKDKIKEIQTIIANEEKVNEQYNDAIASADKYFEDQEYEKSKLDYQKAAGLKSYEEYPPKRIKEIDAIIAELNKKEKDYKDAIAEADNLFKTKDYENSIVSYKKALGFKPDEAYPKGKIDEATKLIDEMKQLQADYDKFITDADAAFKGKNYDEAKSNYEEALKLKEKEQYPKDKLAEIESIINAAAKLEADYNAAIEQGDKAFDKEEYEAAQIAFEKALGLKKEVQYPKDKLAEIKTKLAELAAKKAEEEAAALAQKQLDDKYNAFILAADAFFTSKDYEKAKQGYNNALGVKPDEQYPQDKLDEIERILEELARTKEEQEAAKLAQKELDDQYNAIIAQADKAFTAKTYNDAIDKYNEALEVKSEEQYPKDKIKEIEGILAAIEKKKQEDELAAEAERKKREYYEAVIAQADAELAAENYDEAKNKYNQAIGVIPEEKYPKNKIEEIDDILAKIKAEKDNALLAQKELDEKYKKIIVEADNAFGTEDYTTAKLKYKAALNVKKEEVYPQDQLKRIEDILAELAKKEEEIKLTNNAMKQKQEQYDSYIKMADTDFGNKRYENAKSSYELALGIMPDKTYPKEKIEEILKILAELAANEKNAKEAALAEKEKRASYDNLIYEGDRAMKLQEYKKAQSKFNAALTLYPDEKYPSEKLAEILELLKQKTEEPLVEVTNNGSRAKITDAKEKEIEAKIAALLSKQNSEKAKALQKEREGYEKEEEIRISAGIKRTDKADQQIDKYTDDIMAQVERGNKYHVQNNKDLLATTQLLEKAEAERIKNADKRRLEANNDMSNYVKEQLKFREEQEELSKDKTQTHNAFVDNVAEAKLMMIERGEKMRAQNIKDLEKLIDDTEKNKAKSKKRSEELELDVNKYKAELAKEEEIRITAATKRRESNNNQLAKLQDDMTKEQAKKSNYYKLNVAELTKFKERIDKLEEDRMKKSENYRMANKRQKEKIEEDFVKNIERKNKDYYKDVQQLDKYKKGLVKEEIALIKKSETKRNKANNEIVKEKDKLGLSTQSQEARYKDFKVKLDEERRRNDEFISDLQSIEQEKILLASSNLETYYIGEKQLSQDEDLAKKYTEGITEETSEAGNCITIKRTKVTGSHVDVYERVFYTWGGTFYYKNGINITQALWDKESIEK